MVAHRPKWAATREGFPQCDELPKTAYMTWDGKVYKRSRFGDDRSIKGTAKEAEMKMRRRRYAQKREADRRALAEILEARDARLPWPVRAIGAVLDFIFRRPTPR
jgi:hypothetical protein